ncbi:hypothetical protein EV426DRAFT_579115 [Tirmania nivea]|nr:hypothetical protein EV426DRAFT_579115 [Tirmania nivea]
MNKDINLTAVGQDRLQDSAFAVVISKKRKNLLSSAFSKARNLKHQYLGKQQSDQALPEANPNRRFFIVDLTIDSIHPVLVEEKIDQLKKAAEQSSDERVQKNIKLASEAISIIMEGQDKDDHPIAREEILERLQLIWDLLEISLTSEEQKANQSRSASKNDDVSQDDDIEDEQDEDYTSNEDDNMEGDDEDNEDEDEDVEDTEDIQDSNLNHDKSIFTNNRDEVRISDDNDSDDESIV